LLSDFIFKVCMHAQQLTKKKTKYQHRPALSQVLIFSHYRVAS